MSVLIKPIVTEKFSAQGETLNKYGFLVDRKANKLQIKQAVEAMYKVGVTEVNTIRYDGKFKTRYTKSGFVQGRTNEMKKAIVTLVQGDKIDFYSNI
jgi:large subunit ribosomal protein L23